jgi:hypothetical protein
MAELVVENRHGDTRYLNEARKALADQRKLWGLDALQQLDVRAPRNPYDGMSEQALRERLAQQQRLLEPQLGAGVTPQTDGSPATPETPTPRDVEDTHGD